MRPIRDTVAARRELSKEQIVEAQQTLNAAGIAVPNWPVEWGGKDWSPLQRQKRTKNRAMVREAMAIAPAIRWFIAYSFS